MGLKLAQIGLKWRLFITVALISGIGMVIVGSVLLGNAYRFKRDGILCHAEIVDLFERGESGSHTTFSPVFKFQDSAGKEYIVRSSHSSSHPDVAVGDKVEIIYAPDDPENASINSFIGVWGLSVFITAMGVLQSILVVIVYLFLTSKLSKTEKNSIGR